jgi:hypothetical protein
VGPVVFVLVFVAPLVLGVALSRFCHTRGFWWLVVATTGVLLALRVLTAAALDGDWLGAQGATECDPECNAAQRFVGWGLFGIPACLFAVLVASVVCALFRGGRRRSAAGPPP